MTTPQHIAIIMDGNGRWAAARNLPRTAGHKAGADALRKTIAEAGRLGVKYLTVYAFSSENWSRPEKEVSFLMDLLRMQLKSQLADMHKNNIILKVIGDRDKLQADIRKDIENAEKLTATNTGLTLLIALSYGSRQEILDAVKKSGGDPAKFEESLQTYGIPDPDLLIRTSGEHRISNFLLWQMAYTELYFTDKFWPDFAEQDLADAITDYSTRERRFGNAS